MNIAVLMATYGRPRLVKNCLAMFHAQTHPASSRRLLILDDLGNLSGQDDNWKVWSTTIRSPYLSLKYITLNGLLNRYWPEWEAAAIWDDDDIFGPENLSSHAKALEDAKWSHPAKVFSLYGMADRKNGMPVLEPSGGRFWACAAVRRDLLEESDGGFTDSDRATFDQENLWRWKSKGGEPGLPDVVSGCGPQFIYGWGRARWHDSAVQPGKNWWGIVLPEDREATEVVAEADEETRRLWERVWKAEMS